ncbi:uncharacterized protein MELLADRAFT_77069 [Melampsora larici-populina 98AG31]|uniref:Uncharacterized protein n=1 Tax=Melampsora larici-populina (strain 98AG31 / pathotype 3-4-7) TaxID=747676 RepID=F4RD02_MELLP|nr:uncharacterized protein MELLADRAFT_77069 [Melampsora larici-populina 98AG31]EGG09812.1 hypothetical protein MELLADRAFT_77069 [Melampsora larici-populina 98AG31]
MMSSLHPYAASQYVASSNQLAQPQPSPRASRWYVTPASISLINLSDHHSVKKSTTSSSQKTSTLSPILWKSPQSSSSSHRLSTIPSYLKISSTSNQDDDDHNNSKRSTLSSLLKRSKGLLRRRQSMRTRVSSDQQVIEKPKPTIKIQTGIPRSSQDSTITRHTARKLSTSFLDIDEESEPCDEEEVNRARTPSPSLSDIETCFELTLDETPKKSVPSRSNGSTSYPYSSPIHSFFSTSTIESTHSMFSNSLPVTPSTTTIGSLRSPDPTLESSSSRNPYMNSCIGLLSSLTSLNELSSDLPNQHRSLLNDEIKQWNSRVNKCKNTFTKEDESL